MGLPIGVYYGLTNRTWVPVLCLVTYFLATNVVSYGENHILRKFCGRDLTWLLYGFIFGLASLPVLPVLLALTQACVASAAFWLLMKWSNDGFRGHKLNHKLVELGFGLLGTIIYLCV